jgi:hypothetical protein
VPIRKGTNKGKITFDECNSIKVLPSSNFKNKRIIPEIKLIKIDI